MSGSPDKKRIKAQAKAEKKRLKARVKAARAAAPEPAQPSSLVRGANAVRGSLYVVLGASLVAAVALGQRGVILGLDEIVESLFLATAGKVLLALIGLAFVVYGARKLGLLR